MLSGPSRWGGKWGSLPRALAVWGAKEFENL